MHFGIGNMYKDKRYEKFIAHRNGAINIRGIPFTLTFEEWWDIWDKSGKYEERGTLRGQYGMSRYNDVGPYAIGNVFIQLGIHNVSQAWTGRKHKASSRLQQSAKMKGRPSPLKGRTRSPLSQETKDKISAALKEKANG